MAEQGDRVVTPGLFVYILACIYRALKVTGHGQGDRRWQEHTIHRHFPLVCVKDGIRLAPLLYSVMP